MLQAERDQRKPKFIEPAPAFLDSVAEACRTFCRSFDEREDAGGGDGETVGCSRQNILAGDLS